MTQIEQQLNSKFEEILKEIRTNKNYNATTDEEDVESRQLGPSNPKTKGRRSEHASSTTIERDQDDRVYPSEMSQIRQPYTPIGFANETIDETKTINGNRQENTDHHMVTGPTKNILRQSSTNSNTTNPVGPHAETLLEHPQTSDPVSQIALAIEKLAHNHPEPSTFHPKNTLTFNGKLEKNEKFEYFEDPFHTTLKMQPHMELNGLEADEPLVKTQMTAIKQQTNAQNTKSQSQNTKTKTKTPKHSPQQHASEQPMSLLQRRRSHSKRVP